MKPLTSLSRLSRTTLGAWTLAAALAPAFAASAAPSAPAVPSSGARAARAPASTPIVVTPVADKADKTGIEWAVEPGDVIIYLDEKKLGDAASIKFTEAKPGKHSVRLVLVKDETEIDVVVKKGQVLRFTFTFGG